MSDSPIAAEAPSANDALVTRRFSEEARENVFAPYRERVLYPIAATATLALLPLSALHLMRGDFQVGALLLLLVAMMGADAVAIALRRRPPVPFPLLLLPGAVAILLSMMSQATYAAMWAYPMVMFGYFVLPRRLANATSVSFLGMAASLMALHEGAEGTLRFALSLGFCILVVNVILNVLDAVHRRLLSLSIVDPLTGAFNRRHMEESLALALERRRRSDAAMSLLIVDVDHFKSINDRFGHGAGDHVLRELVRLMRERSRRLDSVFRIGGEEFLLLLPDTRVEEAVIAADALRMHIASHCRAGGEPVTVSIGVADARPDDDGEAWMRRADAALYRAKRAGRNRALAA